jgi:hypothetical protein
MSHGDPMTGRQSKVWAYRGAFISAWLLISAPVLETYGQDAQAVTPPANPDLQEKTVPRAQITVTAKALKERVDNYISKVSGGNLHRDDHPMAVWRVPICALIAGLSNDDGQFVFDRLTDDFTAWSIPLGQIGCRPNFFIIATANPEVTLKSLWHDAPNLSGGQTGFVHFIATPRPVRVWYNAELISSEGAPITFFGIGDNGVFQGIPAIHINTIPNIEFNALPDLQSVIAVIDLKRVVGLDWRQVTDYIAMAGVTKVNLDAHVEGTSSIMSLFSSPGDARPQGLSSWDRSFIKELYQTDPVYRHQRVLIANKMVTDIAAEYGQDK